MARLGPAVGARGQIGFSEEGGWGKQAHAVDNFFEMRSEGIASELGALVSTSLRSDRAVHKRISGTEAAGGDATLELGPSGFTKIVKHSLGKCTTTRLDKAFVLEYDGTGAWARYKIDSTTSGLATNLILTDSGGTGDHTINITNQTVQALMATINGYSEWNAYSPVKLINDGTKVATLQTTDYAYGMDGTKLETIATNVDVKLFPNSLSYVNMGWGVYQHIIDAHSELPAGLTVEVGRDVAAFFYPGSKVNTFNVTANPGEFLTSTVSFMAKGGSTAGSPVADSTNTAPGKNAFKIRYTGNAATATLAYDTTNKKLTFTSATGAESFALNLNVPYVDATSNVLYSVNKIGGLVEFLKTKSYMDVAVAPYANPNSNSTDMKNVSAQSIKTTPGTFAFFNFGSSVPGKPVAWGDYKGTDEGISKTFYVKVSTGGAIGTALLQFSADGVSYGNEAATSLTEPNKIYTGANVDSGFSIFFPDIPSVDSGTSANLTVGDIWTITTIREPATPTYTLVDPFSGFEGALTLDGEAAPIMGWNCTVNNNLFGDKYHMGARTRGMLPEQNRATEGSVNVEFDNLDMYRKFLNRTPANIQIIFTSPEYITKAALGDSRTQYGMTIRQPSIEFNGTTPVIGGPEIVTIDMPYVALFDDANNIPDIRITFVNDEAYV